MIRARFKRNGRDVVLLGLDEENIRRLTAGQPIFVDGQYKLGVPVDFTIVYGTTLQDVINQLQEAGFELPTKSDTD